MAIAITASIRLVLALQTPLAGIEGTVRDEQTGVPLPGAIVALVDLHLLATADQGGRYRLADVPAGPQHLHVRFLGYAPRTLHALVPASGRLTIDVALRAEPVLLRTIVVRPPLAVARLESETASAAFPDRAHTMEAVRNHPLLAEPDALQSLGGGEVALAPEMPTGVHVRGAQSDQVAYLVDGIPVFSPYHSTGLFAGWNPDALAGIRLASVAPPFESPDALAGAISAETRAPGRYHAVQGSVGTAQARVTLDGPTGVAGAGYLVSLRSGFPGFPLPDPDPSYLDTESGDWLAKLEVSALGGRLRLLGIGNENELSAAAGAARPSEPLRRHVFEWGGESLGLDWRGAAGATTIRVTGWSAFADADAAWRAIEGWTAMRSYRRDLGLTVAVEQGSDTRGSRMGLRVERRFTSYRVAAETGGSVHWSLVSHTQAATFFAGHERTLGQHTRLEAGAALAIDRRLSLLPRVSLVWLPSERWQVTAAYAILRQSEQSLRNAESLIGHIFPADLFLGSAAPGVPDARARQVVVGADYRVRGVRLSAQVYNRASRGLLLVGPRAREPFATDGFAVGTGTARGLAVTAAARGARLGVVASYGLQHVRLRDGDASYVPGYATAHLAEAGVILFPSPTFSLRLGVEAGAGRRATPASGDLEWEACNLLDRGCELAGSPRSDPAALGARRLPDYLRLDLGMRKHWHFRIAGRDATVAAFGTVTNLLGRRNVLTYSIDPETGETAGIGMRPLAPLVVGLDWRY